MKRLDAYNKSIATRWGDLKEFSAVAELYRIAALGGGGGGSMVWPKYERTVPAQLQLGKAYHYVNDSNISLLTPTTSAFMYECYICVAQGQTESRLSRCGYYANMLDYDEWITAPLYVNSNSELTIDYIISDTEYNIQMGYVLAGKHLLILPASTRFRLISALMCVNNTPTPLVIPSWS